MELRQRMKSAWMSSLPAPILFDIKRIWRDVKSKRKLAASGDDPEERREEWATGYQGSVE